MRRHTLALLAGATLLIGGAGTGTAFAQDDEPAQPVEACADARAALSAALDDVGGGLSLDLGLDTLSDRLAELDADADADADVSAALALVGDVRTACADQDGDDGDQGDGGDQTPAPTPEPGTGDDGDQDGPQLGDPCTTDEIASGIVGSDGECIGATDDPTTTPVPGGSGSDGGSSGGQVTTVPQGHADTGAL